MNGNGKIVVGTRGSVLALKQVDIVKEVLQQLEPSLIVEVKKIETYGDVNQGPIPLDSVGKGWFTKEIEDALLSGDIDVAVHSLKDMGDVMQSGLTIGAYLSREDARDALVTKNGGSLEALPHGAVIGTDSVRRQVQMRALRPDVEMRSLRGNVLTRLEKLKNEPYDAILLAAAGLKRLGREDAIKETFDIERMTPAPGQGILAVEIREGGAIAALLERINDEEVAHIARIERSFSRALGGGCKSPVGAYACKHGDDCKLVGMYAGDNGRIRRAELSAPWSESERLGERLAEVLLKQ